MFGTLHPLHHDPVGSNRRRVFFFTFVLIALVGLLYTWLRPAIYQCKALLQVSYSLNDATIGHSEGQSAFVLEQLIIHEQRLLSRRMMVDLAAELDRQGHPGLDSDQLVDMLTVEPLAESRLLSLDATGNQPKLLVDVLNSWVDLYLAQFQTTQQHDNTAERDQLQQQLAALEQNVTAKRQEMEQFQSAHQIVSAERDENRAISKIKALGVSMDAATDERAKAQAELKAIRDAIAAGKQVVRPQDQRRLDDLNRRATELGEQMRQYASVYTPKYMALDRTIQATQRKLELLRNKIADAETRSRTLYLEETQRKLEAARSQEQDLDRRIKAFQSQVQEFNSNLEQYHALKMELSDLEQQRLQLKNRLVGLQVNEPFQTRVEVLERPVPSGKPISPHYWWDSGMSLAAALVAAIAAVLLYDALYPRPRPDLVVNANPMMRELQDVGGQLPDLPRRNGIQHQPMAQLGQSDYELTVDQCAQLLAVANRRTAAAIALLLSGIGTDELVALTWQQLNLPRAVLDLGRQVTLTVQTITLLQALAHGGPEKDELVLHTTRGDPLSRATLDTWIGCAAIDAGLAQAERVDTTILEHTYRLYLLRQGLRLGELEDCVGELDSHLMNDYKQYAMPGMAKTVEEIDTTYPALNA